LRWKEYLGKLNAEKGIVITEVAKRDGKYFVYGLLDPLAVDPQVLLQESMFDPEKVVHSWEKYQALHPEFVLARSKLILDPPATVSLKIEGNTLVVEGSAPHKWILRTREIVPAIPGIMYLQEKDLIDRELVEITSTKEHIESQMLNFEEGSSELGPNQKAKLESLLGEIQKLRNLLEVVGSDFHIQIVGHTDESGTEELNSTLSQQRADNIRALLVSKGVGPKHLSARGVGAYEPLNGRLSEQDSSFNRRVSFHVVITYVLGGY
jgi:OOP family OmpA-OmpF porin